MSIQVDCPACLAGDHDGHHRDWNITPGLIGGSYCGCIGDCAERAATAFDASPFGQAFARWRELNNPQPRTDRGELT